jgi:hypothetical protein
MVRRKSNARPTVEDDRRAIIGLWIQPRESGAPPKVLCFSEWNQDYLMAYDFNGQADDAQAQGDCYLAEQGGQRVMLGDEGVVLFRYRLVGDTLDLSPSPTPWPDRWRNHGRGWRLEGRWFRLTYNKQAEPSAGADGGRDPESA